MDDVNDKNTVKPWHEDDRFWALRAPFMFDESRWERTPLEVDQILALLGLPDGAAILDLCCGPGRHCLELARRGYDVTGVDRTRAYLEEARRRADAEGLAVEFVEEDMRCFRREGGFDAVINMFTAFGYFEDPDEDRRVIENIRASLRPKGRLLIEMMGKEILARRFVPRDWQEADGVLLLSERTVSRDWTWMMNREIYIKGGERMELKLDHRIYSAAELMRLLQDCGFGDILAYGDLAGASYGTDAQRLVVVAQAAC